MMDNNNNNLGRMVPHSLEAEEAVLGSALIDPGMLATIRSTIKPGDFFMEKLQWIYQAMLDLDDRGSPVDILTVLNELRARDQSTDDGRTAAYLSHLTCVVPTAIHGEGYARMVRDYSVRRQILNVASDVAQAAYREDRDIQEALGMAMGRSNTMRDLYDRVSPDAKPSGDGELLAVPDLPDGVLPGWVNSRPVGTFIDAYVSHAMSVSPMTPRIFHESAALVLGSMAIARRLKAALDFDDVYPNIFVTWLAPSTLWHKTTSLNVFRRLVRVAFPHLLIPQDMTPESMLANMSGRDPTNYMFMSQTEKEIWEAARDYAAQRGLVLDEMSGLMSGAGRDYQAGLIEAFLRFYDCDEAYTRITQKEGMVTVKNAYVCFLGASTPIAMAPFVANERLWSNGWWARFGLLTPDCDRPVYDVPVENGGVTKLIGVLRGLFERLPAASYPNSPEARCVNFDDGVLDVWKRYYKAVGYDLVDDSLDHRLWPLYGRLHVQALKFSMIMAALDWTHDETLYTPLVQMEHMLRAIQIAEEWRSSAHRALAIIGLGEAQRFLQQVLALVIEGGNKGVTLRELYRGLRRTPAEVMDVLRQLIMSGEVEENNIRGSRGRPTTYFRRARG